MTTFKKLPVRVSKNRTIPEVFENVLQMESREDKITLLRMYNTKALKWVIDAMYNVDWEGVKIPEYVPNHRPVGICNMTINTALSRLRNVVRYSKDNPEVAEKNLLIVLEEVSADEAKLLVDIIQGRKVAGITKAMFREAYPDLFRFQNEDKESKTMGEN